MYPYGTPHGIQRSNQPVPDTAEQAVDICEAGGIAEAKAITVRSVTGEKYDRIIRHTLGPIPPHSDGGDEREDGDLQMPEWPPDDSEVPF